MKATFIKRITSPSGATQRLYRLDPPINGNDWDGDAKGPFEYVVVSAVMATFSGPETYIFPADAEGNITDFGELDGSYRGGMSHEKALRDAGYTDIS